MPLPPLRDYQSDAIDCVRTKLKEHSRVVLCAPTGSGKTRMITELGIRAVAKQSTVLAMATRDELVDQLWGSFNSAGLSPGVIASSSDLPRRPGPVQVASLQTLLAHPDWLPEKVDLVLPDEAHHLGAGAETWSALLERFPKARVVGPTATPERGDGTGMSPIFTDIVQATDVPGLSVRRLTERGLLVHCEIARPRTALKLVRDDVNALAIDPIEAWMIHSPGRQGFIFFQSVPEAIDGCAALQARGVVARVIHGKTPKLERRAIVEGFKAGRIHCLCNVYVLTEGFDAPQASLCVLARNCGTAGMMLQIAGRILRAHPGKRDCLLVDLPGVTWTHGTPEDDRVWSLTGKASLVLEERRCPVCSKTVTAYPCAYCGHEPTRDLFAGPNSGGNTVVLDEPLTMYHRALLEGDEQRREALGRWVLGRIIRKQQPFWASHRFRDVYGIPCPTEWYNTAVIAALEHVRGTKSDPGRPEARTASYDLRVQRRLYGARSVE